MTEAWSDLGSRPPIARTFGEISMDVIDQSLAYNMLKK